MKKTIIAVFVVMMLVMITSVAAIPPLRITREHVQPTYEWEFNVEGHETGGRWDYIIFGEKPDASDGVDLFLDVPKCPPPPRGYVRIWIYNEELPWPYNYAWFEYRHSPDTYKVWNVYVQWVPQSGYDDTEITLTWERTGRTEYKNIMLTDTVDMLKTDSYSFTCQAYVPTFFEIVCSRYHKKI